MCYNRHLLVRHSHRWEGKHGDLALLPPVFSTDPTLLILLPVRYIGELWLNDIFNMPVAAGSTGMGKARPIISRLSCCHQEVIASKTLADWTENERVVYPSPPTRLTPKNDEADRPDNDPSPSKGSRQSNKGSNRSEHDDELVGDDKSEHGGRSGGDATPKEKEDQGSEDESDNQSKTPKNQTAVSRDSGLGTSSSGHGVGTGALASNPCVNLSTGLPLPTRLLLDGSLGKTSKRFVCLQRRTLPGLEETSMAMLDRVLSGFKRSGGHAREYIYETAAIAINFFSQAGDMEAELESSKALKFQEAVNGMKGSIHDLIR